MKPGQPTTGVVTEMRKKGEFYEVVGYDRGRRVSGELHASYVDGKPPREVERVTRRGVEILAQHERESKRG